MALSAQIMNTIKNRVDLKALYDFKTGKAKDPSDPKVKGIPTLTSWWNQYGKNEYPNVSFKKKPPIIKKGEEKMEEIDYTKLPVPDKPQKDLIKGSLVKFSGKPKVYLVDEKNGKPILRHVVSEQTIAKIPGTWSNVITLPDKYSKDYKWIPPTKKRAGYWQAYDIEEGKSVKGKLPFAPKSVKLYKDYGVDIPDIDKAIAQDLPKFAEQAKVEAEKKAAKEARPDLMYNGKTIKPTDPNYEMYKKYGAMEQPLKIASKKKTVPGLVYVKHPTLDMQLGMDPEAAQRYVSERGYTLIGETPLTSAELAAQKATDTAVTDVSKTPELGSTVAEEFDIDMTGWTDEMKSVFNMMTEQIKVLEDLGKTVNPDIEITPETIAEFEDTIKANLDPQFQQKFDIAKEQFESGLDFMAQQRAAARSTDERQFVQNLEQERANLAERGLAFSGIRTRKEKELGLGYEEAQRGKEREFTQRVKGFTQPFEEKVGEQKLKTFTVPEMKQFQGIELGLKPGFKLGGPKTLPVGFEDVSVPFGKLDVERKLAEEAQMEKLKQLKGQEIGMKIL